jgi:rhodanese-related sulfurtransferase
LNRTRVVRLNAGNQEQEKMHRMKLTRGPLRLRAALWTVTLAMLASCSSNKVSDRDIEFLEVADAPSLGSASLGMLGVGDRRPLWVDPRTPATFAQEHIPGAVNIPLASLREDDDDPRLDGFNLFIVYGSDYGDPVATAMTKRLLAAGFDEVRLLRGGLRAWKQAGNAVETVE